MKKRIYLDNAAATPTDARVLKEMQPFFSKVYGNPSSIHSEGKKAREAIEQARKTVASILKVKAEEVIFTSGGTESINLAIQGIARARGEGQIIISSTEHPAVQRTCKHLEHKGFEIRTLPVDATGLVSPVDLENAIRNDTILISIIYANNEIGTVQNIKELTDIAKKYKVPFHTDACQAPGLININVSSLGVDLMTLNGSKIYGPKGVGVLYKNSELKLAPILRGGHQEFNLRAGTENVPAIVGFAKALELAEKEQAREVKRLTTLRNYLKERIHKVFHQAIFNGHPTQRLANNLHISFLDLDGEALVLALDNEGIAISTGAACQSSSNEQSNTLKAIKLPEEAIKGSIRVTLGKSTTKQDIQKLISILPKVVRQVKKMHELS
jgi:cysteine desulfurase